MLINVYSFILLVSHKSDFFGWILIVLYVNIIYYVDFYDNQYVTQINKFIIIICICFF